MKGVPLLRWSKSAFDVFCFDDVTDTELLKANDDESSLIAQITVFEWRCILKHSSRDLFMQVVNSDVGQVGIRAYVDSLVLLEHSASKDSFFDGSGLVVDDCPVDAETIITTGIEQRDLFDIHVGFANYAMTSDPEAAPVLASKDLITNALVRKDAKWDSATIVAGLQLKERQTKKHLATLRMYSELFGSEAVAAPYSVDDWNKDLSYQAALEFNNDDYK